MVTSGAPTIPARLGQRARPAAREATIVRHAPAPPAARPPRLLTGLQRRDGAALTHGGGARPPRGRAARAHPGRRPAPGLVAARGPRGRAGAAAPLPARGSPRGVRGAARPRGDGAGLRQPRPHAARRPALAAQEDSPDLRRPQQLRGAAVDHRAPALQHVAAGGDGERQLHVLLDEQQGHAVAVDPANRLGQVRDDLGREAEERLVDHEQPRPRHEAARDGDHLLLTAGERVRRLTRARGDDREELGDALVFRLAGAARRRVIAAEPDVLAHAEVREEAPPLEHVGDATADDAVSGQTRDGLALEGDGAGARAQQARDAVHQRGLAAAVGAEEGDHLAALDGQARPPERLVVAEQDVEARDLEHHGRHAWPRYASMTRGLRTISDGGASAMTSPSWSATIRWASSMITRMLCSMTTSARPPACSSRTRRTSPGMVAWSTPPVTSSSSSSRGRVASARASSRRLRCPVDSPRAWASTRSARPTEASA